MAKLDMSSFKKSIAAIKPLKEKNIVEEEGNASMISRDAAIRAFYFLMAADGEFHEKEMERFDAIGNELDVGFRVHKGNVISECNQKLPEYEDNEFYIDDLKDVLAAELRSGQGTKGANIPAVLFLWNMYATAFCDGEFSREERLLIRFAARVLGVEKSIPLEMERSINTLQTLQMQEERIRNSAVPYAQGQDMLEEIEKRKQAVQQSIYALLAD